MNQYNSDIQIEYRNHVKHVYSHFRTTDEELAFALTIEEPAETIEVSATTDGTTVVVSTTQAFYTFRQFQSGYAGHSLRGLVDLLLHFEVDLPADFMLAHHSFQVYLTGSKVVCGESEFNIALRDGIYQLVESVRWEVTSIILDRILQLAELWHITPEEVVENAITLLLDFGPEREPR